MLEYQFLERIKNLPFVEAIYLFGSRARGDAGEKSDIDLAIVCEGASGGEWLQVVDIIDEADTLLKIDCLRLDTLANERLKAEIERDKVVLYERK
jgi:predicted nucleotidyltransferase